MTRRKFWGRWMVAAAVILVVSAGGIYMLRKQAQVSAPVAKSERKDIKAPSASHASITLANGTKVYLDSAVSGSLTRQSNVDVIKLADGSVAYKGSASTLTYNTLSNPRGSKVITMTLADGSRVWLNTGSSITYPVAFIGKERAVTVNGEAYFEVVHNAARPFRVKAGDQLIEDIGTAFNVNAYTDEPGTTTTLVEGAVKINNQALLHPGQQARNKTGAEINVADNADVAEAVAWKEGRFQFNEADIPAVMRQVSRWYNVGVEYEGMPRPHGFTGKISRSVNLSEVLDILEYTGIHFRIAATPKDGAAGKIIVTP
ncbi:MAG: FecR domain-containing protein [Bacteroidetes bacterium]|nr:FecR domain-containing protein [Bacteroidota bacterium]